jgi:hypothetical protein
LVLAGQVLGGQRRPDAGKLRMVDKRIWAMLRVPTQFFLNIMVIANCAGAERCARARFVLVQAGSR